MKLIRTRFDILFLLTILISIFLVGCESVAADTYTYPYPSTLDEYVYDDVKVKVNKEPNDKIDNEMPKKEYNIEVRTRYGIEGEISNGELGRILEEEILPKIKKDENQNEPITDLKIYIVQEYNVDLDELSVSDKGLDDFEQEDEAYTDILKVVLIILFIFYFCIYYIFVVL